MSFFVSNMQHHNQLSIYTFRINTYFWRCIIHRIQTLSKQTNKQSSTYRCQCVPLHSSAIHRVKSQYNIDEILYCALLSPHSHSHCRCSFSHLIFFLLWLLMLFEVSKITGNSERNDLDVSRIYLKYAISMDV